VFFFTIFLKRDGWPIVNSGGFCSRKGEIMSKKIYLLIAVGIMILWIMTACSCSHPNPVVSIPGGPLPGAPGSIGSTPGSVGPGGGPIAPPPGSPGTGPAPNPTQTLNAGGSLVVVNPTALAMTSFGDMAITRIYPKSDGSIWFTIENIGSTDYTYVQEVRCTGYYTDSAGAQTALAVNTMGPDHVTYAPGETSDFPTWFSRDPTIATMFVSCHLYNANDLDSSNDALFNVQVK
jgi:hypothetical protein